jgi:hypothetical protein
MALVLGCLAASTVVLSQPSRESEVRFFTHESAINRNIIESLIDYRPQLESVDVVGIIGVKRWSPWLKTQGEFLAQLGFDNRWMVFIEENPFYGEQLAFDPYQQPGAELDPAHPVSFLRLIELERFPDLPLLVFDNEGRGLGWWIDARDYFAECIEVTAGEATDECKKGPQSRIRERNSGVNGGA